MCQHLRRPSEILTFRKHHLAQCRKNAHGACIAIRAHARSMRARTVDVLIRACFLDACSTRAHMATPLGFGLN
jgi:hypothetical protein